MKQKIITILSFCLFLIGIIGSQSTFADTVANLLISSATIHSDGYITIDPSSSRNVYYIELDNTKSGTLSLVFTTSYKRNYVLSNDDVPEDLAIGYTFISDDFHELTGSGTKSIQFSNMSYIYVSSADLFEYNITYNNTPGPTPSISPSPSPEISPTLSPTPVPENPGSNIPYHFDIPLDYYFVVIIILLGGVLICQFFKK